ncbi:unannotated protein [freshwater metagenome]|uniref:Unannotated protein n=1 Tax=freshwater metagenome TaxID=449393 RepID=A0A6J7PAM4_9ZZZZ
MLRTDRRRVVIASLFTAVALPALWFFSSDSANKNGGSNGSRATAPPSTKYEPGPPLFVGGTDTPKRPTLIDVAVPSTLPANSMRAQASFHRYPDTLTRPCSVLQAPDGAVVTVTNIDNGQSTTCTNTLTLATLPDGIGVLLHTEIFAEIGNVTDAPIPVRVSW